VNPDCLLSKIAPRLTSLRSKLVADRSWRTEREKTTQLERELAFYQAQSATAMVRPSAVCNWMRAQPP
jgi:Mg-chelatase subunit ChlI